MRLIIHVEGQTEHTFVEQILKSHLERFGYDVSAVINKTSSTSRGGLSNYQQFRKNTLRLKPKNDAHDYLLTTMVDLYGLPSNFPGIEESKTMFGELDDPQKKVEYLEKKLKDDLHIDKFIPYIQLHEFEALLFSDIKQINLVLSRELPRSHLPILPKLQKVLSNHGHGSPENIDHNKGPSSYLNDICDGSYAKAKIHWGNEIAKNIGLSTMRKECKHFGQWLTKLEDLAEPQF